MKKNLRIVSFLYATALIASIATNGISRAAISTSAPIADPESLTREELEQQLLNRTEQLEQINRQVETTKDNLKSTQQQKNTLQREVSILQNSIENLNLNIKGDTLSVEKLTLEIATLELDLQDIKSAVASKRAGVEAALQQLQKHENTNLLTSLLSSQSLHDAVFTAESLRSLQTQLIADITKLRELTDSYEEKLRIRSEKRDEITFHKKNLVNKKSIVEDQRQTQQTILKNTKNQESLYQKQLTELQKQQQQIASEIEDLDEALRAKIDPNVFTAHPGTLAFPLSGGRSLLTQDYGATAFAQYGYRGKWHNGVDLGAPVGTPIYAAESGRIVSVGDQDRYCYRGAYGKYIVITHDNKSNLTTLYGHLSKYIVSAGDHVERGQLIGYVGRTGYATGPHLHLTVFATPTFYMGGSKTCGPMPHGGDLNPLNYL